jgi:hypothetical protein
MSDEYDDPIYVCADHSRFDAHVNAELLSIEHGVYKRCFGYQPELVDLLAKQVKNRGQTRGGIKYQCVGKRMSGDCNTALGNSILNYCMLRTWLESSGVKANILLDGDDSVVVMDKSSQSQLKDLAKFMLKFGMVTESEVVTDIRHAEFCQSRVVLGSKGPYFCPNPAKVLDTVRRSAANVQSGERMSILRASIACQLISNPAMPMLRPLFRWLKDNPGTMRVPSAELYRLQEGYGIRENELYSIAGKRPTEDERFSFFMAWGIDPSEQRHFEEGVSFKSYPCAKESKHKAKDAVCVEPGNPDEEPMPEEDLTQYEWSQQSEEMRGLWINRLTSS